MGIGKKISRKARPTEQTGSVRRKEQYYRKNRNIASMCEHLEGCSMLEKGGPRNALPLCARREDREKERERAPRTHLGGGYLKSRRANSKLAGVCSQKK